MRRGPIQATRIKARVGRAAWDNATIMEERPQIAGRGNRQQREPRLRLRWRRWSRTPILIVTTARHGSAVNVVGASVFAATMVLLYFASTLYHALPGARAKAIFRKLDHGAIYLLIAGTYTPFTLGALGGAWGWTLFGLVWSLAAVGVTLKAFDRLRTRSLSTRPVPGDGLAGA